MTPDPAAIYQGPVLKQVGRLLSRQDREPFSKTYGCFDRTFWGWKFTDFPGARFQEGVCALAHLYARPFPGNGYAGRDRVLEWARAGLRYWRRVQYPDGSFDEAYPFEHSLAATAFTGFYLGEAFLLLEDRLPAGEQADLRATFARAGDWLCANDEGHGLLSNHLAAAAAALTVIHRICGDARYEARARHFLGRIYAHQSAEGWFEEYGGADPGYQTHGTFYLARIWERTGEAELRERLERSLPFLTYCLHPDRTLGGEYGSRNTEFYFPAGFEILAGTLPDAARIARFLRPAVQAQTAAGLAAMDAYNFLPMLNNYLFAAAAAPALEAEPAPLPCQEEGERHFPEAGLYFKSTGAYYAILGLSKGGTLKVFDRASGRLAGSDCGYWARINDGRIVGSQSLDRTRPVSREVEGFTIEAPFVQVNQQVPAPWLFVGFRLFSLTLGRVPALAAWLKRLLVQVLVSRRRVVDLRLSRRVRFEPDRVRLADRIIRPPAMTVRQLRAGAKFATIHMGSSRYFQPQELEGETVETADWARDLMAQGTLSIDRTLAPAAAPGEEAG